MIKPDMMPIIPGQDQLPGVTGRIIQSTAQAHGLGWERILADAGLPADVFDDLASSLTGSEELALQKGFVDASSALPDLWFVMGMQQRLLSFGPLGIAALTAATLGEGLRDLCVFGSLSKTLPRYRLVAEDGEIREIVADPLALGDPIRAFFIERAVGATFRFIDDLHPTLSPVDRIEFALTDRFTHECERVFPVPVTFDAPVTKLVLKPGAAATRQPMADELLNKTSREQCANLLATAERSDDLVDGLRQLLLRSFPKLPSSIEASSHVGLSERTLHRRLAARGLTYGEICEEARRRRALHLIERTNASIKSIAQMLGYAENASFTRAFKRWTGASPLQFRRTESDRAGR